MKRIYLFLVGLLAVGGVYAQTVTVDFTDPNLPTWGTDAQHNADGLRMLKMGDTNRNGRINYHGNDDDRIVILNAVGVFTPNVTISGYYDADVNMNGQVSYHGANDDRTLILNVVGVFTPNTIVEEQIPQ